MKPNEEMIESIQTLWDQMRDELRTDPLPQLNQACRSLLSSVLGPLTAQQIEDLEAIERSLFKLTQRIEGDPIEWIDYSEAAHALRGPLNATIGFSRLMLKGIDGPVNEAQTKALQTIHTGSRRLLVLFNLLLDALLLTRNDMSFSVEPIRVDETLEELVALGRTIADKREFAFESDVRNQIAGATIKGDAKRLKQALSALLTVSAKSMREGLMILSARIDGNVLTLQLKTQACQLPAPLLADLSVLLTDKADPAHPYDVRIRLGLAWRLMTGMGGRLDAQNTADTCTFTITLPMV